MGVDSAIASVVGSVSKVLVGFDESDQRSADLALRSVDELGANAMVATSAAVAKAGASARALPLWAHLRPNNRATIPLPMINLFSGNLHAADGMSIQDVLVVPSGAPSLEVALEWTHQIYRVAGDSLRASGRGAAVGDEGGYATVSMGSRDAIELANAAIVAAGLEPGGDVSIALDIAASHLLVGADYSMDGVKLSGEGLADTYFEWCRDFPIISIEDPFAEDDWNAWSRFCLRARGSSLQVLGDDLITTDMLRLRRAHHEGAANAVLVKANQTGTISEALDVAERAQELGMRAVVSARSGETEDDWLSDLAVATGCGQIKIGSIVRSERLAKYNQLLRISRQSHLPYAGAEGVFRPH